MTDSTTIPVRAVTDLLEAHEGTEEYLFISYSHVNTDEVYGILHQLQDLKFRFWYDDTMETGEDFRRELHRKIEDCTAVVLFMSKASMNSKYCGMEIITAHQLGKRIYPILLEPDVEVPAPLKLILDTLQHVKAHTGEQRYVDRLIKSLPPETMKRLEIEDGVVLSCEDNGADITVPDGVHSIADDAFRECLQLERVSLPESLRSIGARAFRGCSNLRELSLGPDLETVGHSAFRDCVRLTKVRVQNPKTLFIGRCFENCASLTDVDIPDTCEEIAEASFNSCGSLENFTFPHSLSIVGESAFEDCEKLNNLYLPPALFKIDASAFADCTSLKNVDFPANLSKIGRYGFKGCVSLVKVRLPAGLTYISSDAFRECTALDEYTVEPANRYYKAIDGVLYNKSRSQLVAYPSAKAATSFDIPDSVVTICDWSFTQADNLEYLTVPDSVDDIGEGAFYSAENINEIVLPDSVSRIDDIAFRGCTALRRLVVPDRVWHIGWGAFLDCPNLVVECSPGSFAHRYCEANGIHHAG